MFYKRKLKKIKKNRFIEWLQDYLENIPDSEDLEIFINQQLLDFEKMEQDMRKEIQAKKNIPDADGFITVVRSHGQRNTNKDTQGTSVTAMKAEATVDLKPKDYSVVDFYRFQMRQGKRNQLAELRKKFEQDKLKIEELKKKRKFKPY